MGKEQKKLLKDVEKFEKMRKVYENTANELYREKRAAVVKAWQAGVAVPKIMEAAGVSRQTVYNWVSASATNHSLTA